MKSPYLGSHSSYDLVMLMEDMANLVKKGGDGKKGLKSQRRDKWETERQ